MSVLDSLRQTFRVADAFDIALVAVFLYALFMWIRASTSRPILYGMGILAVVYLVARRCDMYMTTGLFQAGLTVAAIAAIVVFQEDLRRAFARVASLGRLPRRYEREQTFAHFDTIIELMFELASKKIGALIVVQGEESLTRHIHGGAEIDARVNKALLDSIFDPHSMGHDGAVIIEHDRIRRFAAHLPLSQTKPEGRGTRHSAALGLTEVSDALVIVVSEERGQVSVAQNTVIETLRTPDELAKRLKGFLAHRQTVEGSGLFSRVIRENVGLKLVAAMMACAAWFAISFEAGTVQKTFVVPVEYRRLPDNMDIDENAPTEVRITLSGYERAFNLLAPSTLKVALDISHAEQGLQQIVIEDAHVKTPANLSLFRSSPRVLSFGIHQWVRNSVPVDARTEGRLAGGLTLEQTTVTPARLRVLMWKSRVSSIVKLYTEPIALDGLTASMEIKAKVVLPAHVRLDSEQPPEVLVKIGVRRAGEPSPATP